MNPSAFGSVFEMAKKKVYSFWNHYQGIKKEQKVRFSGHSLCPGNGARSSLRACP